MAELKREYVVPLRAKTRNAPKWRRSKKAVSVLKEFISKHMKTDNVIVCPELNEKIWENGIKNPPGKVSVTALKTDVAGVERVIVNLSEVGVDKYVEFYKTQPVEVEEEAPQVAEEAKEETPKANKEEEKAPESKEEAKEEVAKDE